MRTVRNPVGLLLGGLLVVMLAGGPATATTHHVGPGELIGDALAAASAGDSVVVACGTYEETGLVVPGGVVLRSEDGDPACVTITTTGGEPILTCDAAGPQTRIEGLTLTVAGSGWAATVARGAGLKCDASAPTVSRCRFVDLEADYGGAVFCGAGSSPTFLSCEFTGNHARAVGGALNCVDGSSPLIDTCLFFGNTIAASGAAGSAVNAAGGSQPHLRSCTLVGNGAGGTLAGFDTDAPQVEATIISSSAGAAWFGDLGGVPVFACTDIWGNAADWSGPLAGQAEVAGNLAADPVFCGSVAPDRPWGLDTSSPCAPGGTAGCELIGAFVVTCSGSVGNDDRPPDTTPVVPAVTRLRGNRPNPFNPSTIIAFDLKRPGPAVITVYDLAGRLVARPLDETLPAGEHTVAWDGRDRHGRAAAAGVYVVQLVTDLTVDTARIALVKWSDAERKDTG